MNQGKITNTESQRSRCPITNTLDLIGDKWTLLVIRDMMFLGKKTFGEFTESGEGISTNILSSRLKKLEKHKLVRKQTYSEKPLRYAYYLTEKGRSLEPLLRQILWWGAEHIEDVFVPTEEMVDTFIDKHR